MFESKLESVKKENKIEPLVPLTEEIAVLSPAERRGFRLAHRMNQGGWKRLMTFFQRHIGSLWIFLATYNLMRVHGLEKFEALDAERPVLIVANHRSFFDMYTVSSVLFRRTRRPLRLFFPVRAKFFYDKMSGWAVNFVMGWFSMYPPFFRETGEVAKREFDKYSLRRLIQLCSANEPNVIGFHPEGKRNLTGGPYDLLPAQPGVGKVIYESRPQVIPVFIAGLGNDLPRQILGNWRGGEKVRIWFGDAVDLVEFYGKPDKLRTHKEIADRLMEEIAELAQHDREEYASE
ncbi:MAG: 1-acyl-sn-glycerol-3-phosphate acyltransferase [Acidobacteria bacterium OLB17]|nr:MAG: 1-acyl-sn-glycerol-3-phosphate acyltransferase [Acidobacteria bacterium OLB17]MCZ2391808.1 1-acyl-sn-glycerol-3-phosphate acyltransferase [Acidobacteriota bacterium]